MSRSLFETANEYNAKGSTTDVEHNSGKNLIRHKAE